MPYSTVRRLTTLVLLLVLALAAPAAAAGKRPQPPRVSVALLSGPLEQLLGWLGFPVSGGKLEARPGTHEKLEIPLPASEDDVTGGCSASDRGGMIDPNG